MSEAYPRLTLEIPRFLLASDLGADIANHWSEETVFEWLKQNEIPHFMYTKSLTRTTITFKTLADMTMFELAFSEVLAVDAKLRRLTRTR
jgi:hypothetical protein